MFPKVRALHELVMKLGRKVVLTSIDVRWTSGVNWLKMTVRVSRRRRHQRI